MQKHSQEINQLTDQPTKRLAYRNTSTQPRQVPEYVRHFYSYFLTSEMHKNSKKWNMGQGDRPTDLEKILTNETENGEK